MPPIVTTAYTATVMEVVKGNLRVGDTLEVKELGGVHRGVRYVQDDAININPLGRYLVFLEGEPGLPYSLLNPIEGKYPEDALGEPRVLPGNGAQVSNREMAEYLDAHRD